MSVNTIDLRCAAIRHLHFVLPVPTSDVRVTETMNVIHREAAAAGQASTQNLAATIDSVEQIVVPVGDDLIGPRDRSLLLIGFALPRAELAAICVEHLEARIAVCASPCPSPKVNVATKPSRLPSPMVPLRLALLAFREIYNTIWLIQRLAYQTLAQVRQEKLSASAIAA